MATCKDHFRWGILGAAHIARKNWQAIRQTGNGVVSAVASRDLARCREFIEQCQAAAPFEVAPRALGGYEELIRAQDIDGIYIPLPTGLRKPWVQAAAEAGKHVVSEKPCGVTVADLEEMIEICRRCGVQFMDGVMFMHSRRLAMMRQVLDDGQSVGRIRRIESAFSFPGSEDFLRTDIRVHSELEPHGCLGDLGWYCIRLALWAMNWRLPVEVTGRTLAQSGRSHSAAAVPTDFSGELRFDGGVSAGFYCSFLAALQQWAVIGGTSGYLHLRDFVLPHFGSESSWELEQAASVVRGCDFNMESRRRRYAAAEYSNSHPTAQETNLFREFAEQARSGKLNALWPEMALKTQRVMQACRESAEAGGAAVQLRR